MGLQHFRQLALDGEIGIEEVIGSWKIIDIRRRGSLSSAGLRPRISSP
jgi:hypothetical protein